MKNFKFILVFVLGLATLAGCFGEESTMDKMEEVNDNFKSEMDSQGYVFVQEYKDSTDVYTYTYISDDEFIATSAGEYTYTLKCNWNGETSMDSDVDFGLSEDDLVDVCDEELDYLHTEYDYMLEGMFDSSYDIDYKDDGESYVASGIYEEGGSFDLTINKDLTTLIYDDEWANTTITIGTGE